MVEKQINAKILFCSLDELSEAEKKLVLKAKEATVNSYAPYSAFRVGAALQLENGQVVTGNNQENAAYPSGLCAERVTLFYANANWPDTPVITLAIAARGQSGFLKFPISPCGSCRQVLLESERRQKRPIRILLYGEEGITIISSVRDLLPLSFDETYLSSID